MRNQNEPGNQDQNGGLTTTGSASMLRPLAIASGLGCTTVVIFAIFIGGGLWLDHHFDTSPVWTLIGIAVGVVALGAEFVTLARSSKGIRWNNRGARPVPDEDDDEF